MVYRRAFVVSKLQKSISPLRPVCPVVRYLGTVLVRSGAGASRAPHRGQRDDDLAPSAGWGRRLGQIIPGTDPASTGCLRSDVVIIDLWARVLGTGRHASDSPGRATGSADLGHRHIIDTMPEFRAGTTGGVSPWQGLIPR
jgi:hypothetical protein